MKDITTLGIDLAKNVFQLHGTNKWGKTVLKKRLSREKLPAYMAKLSPCTIGMEACGGAHYWARAFKKSGHTPKLMPPQYVKPYVKTNKNDPADAQACNEAVSRDHMRFVSIKTPEQQDIQSLHRLRSLLVKQRTQQSNQIRGILLEYGIEMARGKSTLNRLAALLEVHKDKISLQLTGWIQQSYTLYQTLDAQIMAYEKALQAQVKENGQLQRLTSIPGIGVLSATALLSAVGSGETFQNGRQLSAWLGLVPRQCSSGNKQRLLGISKRGDRYLRALLVHGARSVVNVVGKKKDAHSLWIQQLLLRLPYNKVCVAVANKNARIVWALLGSEETFDSDKAVGCMGEKALVCDDALKEAA